MAKRSKWETPDIAASRLPALPTSGYATNLEKWTSDAVQQFMRAAERDRILLLSVVVDGPRKWRNICRTSWRGLAIDDRLLDSIYDYFVMQAGPNPALQLEALTSLTLKERLALYD